MCSAHFANFSDSQKAAQSRIKFTTVGSFFNFFSMFEDGYANRVDICNSTSIIFAYAKYSFHNIYSICRNKRPGSLIFRSNIKIPKTIKSHRFCVLPPLKNHPSTPIGLVCSPLWKITHQHPLVLCPPPFKNSPIKSHWFCVLPPLKNHPSKRGFSAMHHPRHRFLEQRVTEISAPLENAVVKNVLIEKRMELCNEENPFTYGR